MAGRLSFKPVTAKTWPDFEALFNAPGGPSYCWCMVFRATPEETKDTSSKGRHAQMHARIEARKPTGLLAYRDGKPAAWVSIAPKALFHRLGGPEPETGEVVWSLTCMFIPRAQRGEGLSRQLIGAAMRHAKKRGATVIEAYPVAPDSPSYRFMGFVPVFEDEGFVHHSKAGTRRHVMRHGL